MTHAFEARTICYFVVKSRKSTISHSRISFNGWMNMTSDPELSKKEPADAAEWIMDVESRLKYHQSSPPVLLRFYPAVSLIDYCRLNWCRWPQINPPPRLCRCLDREAESVHDDSVESLSECDTKQIDTPSPAKWCKWWPVTPMWHDPHVTPPTLLCPAEKPLLQSFKLPSLIYYTWLMVHCLLKDTQDKSELEVAARKNKLMD